MNAPLLPSLPGYDNPQLIAHGTTALVFRATQTRLNRPVAIKVITADTGSVPVNAARELATTVALSSQPHIVSIIDTGVTDDDRPYIVMEYCEGGSYAQILRHDGLLSVEDVLEVGIKIGEALHAAHQAGIVHRDVKPSNILRSRFGPALTDFGIARAPDELGGTLTREMMTPHHASPEALLHQAQSGISDIYSLASTMWTLLLGHPPFVDPTRPPLDMYAFRDRVLHDALPPMTRDDVPIWLIGELNRAMSKLPAQRHGSALEFADALRRGALGLAPAPGSMPAPAPVPAPRTDTARTDATRADGTRTDATRADGTHPDAAKPDGARAATAQGRVHVPGVPAQAWPAADPNPIGMPPPKKAPAGTGTTTSAGVAGWVTNPPGSREYRPPPRPQPGEAAQPDLAPSAPSAAESGPDLDPRPAEEGGWLGPRTDWGSTPDALNGPPSTRRFDERDLAPPPSSHRGTLLAVLIGVAALAIAGAAVLVLASPRGSSSAGKEPTATPAPTRFISAQTVGQPRDIRLTDDRGTSVTVAWTDPTAGTVTFVVVGTGPGGEKLETKSIRRGVTTATYGQLSPNKNYCFVVGAVYAVDSVALATEVCTKR